MRPCIITVSPLPSSDKCLHGTRGQGPETLLLSSVPRRGPRGRSVLPRAGEQLARSRAAPVHCSALILGAGGGGEHCMAVLLSQGSLSASPSWHQAAEPQPCLCRDLWFWVLQWKAERGCSQQKCPEGQWDVGPGAVLAKSLIPASSGCCSQNWRSRSCGAAEVCSSCGCAALPR